MGHRLSWEVSLTEMASSSGLWLGGFKAAFYLHPPGTPLPRHWKALTGLALPTPVRPLPLVPDTLLWAVQEGPSRL